VLSTVENGNTSDDRSNYCGSHPQVNTLFMLLTALFILLHPVLQPRFVTNVALMPVPLCDADFATLCDRSDHATTGAIVVRNLVVAGLANPGTSHSSSLRDQLDRTVEC